MRPTASRRAPVVRMMVLMALLLGPALASPTLAYIGPGAGFAAIGSLSVMFLAFLAALLMLLTWPFRLLLSLFRRRRTQGVAQVKRVVVLGLDGMDPERAGRLMQSGRMPHFVRLAEQGGFKRLGTTYPAISPVAWSSFATGVHPSRHAIFDFLDRDLRSYVPILSSSQVAPPKRFLKLGPYRIPLGKARVKLLRRSRSFWSILGKHGVFSSVLRVPITFPPEKFRGVCLSSMCAPDLRGTQGSFTYVSDQPSPEGGTTGGTRIQARHVDGAFHAAIPGPDNPIRETAEPTAAPLVVEPLAGGKEAVVTLAGKKFTLPVRTYSPWVEITFRPGLGVKIRGICRLYINELEPRLSLYITPIQIDPERPALPISHPRYYATYLSKLLGRFSTLGLAEDTWALNERVIDEEAFLEQTRLIHAEREALFFNGLRKTRRGVVAMVFDSTDRVQHMFYRYLAAGHPGNRGLDEKRYVDVIDDLYVEMDDLLRRTMEQVDESTLLLVMSDHGFKHFRRGVNLNAWLRDQGYLVLKDDAREGGEYFEGVDWSHTRAYTFGLTGLYVNQAGREAQGVVQPGDVPGLVQEIQEKLEGLVDPQGGAVAIRKAYATTDLYPGPYLDRGPEILVGYNDGYRASWDAALGQTTAEVFSDNTKAWSGDHVIDPELVPGLLLSNRVIDRADPSILDIAPTILEMFGVEPPPYMDGKPIFDAPLRQASGKEARAWKAVASS
jgi:predicted AlkP superfamily phosphohydrolase/phosphomutase